MDTPICDFVRQYAASHTARFHMPGHKGQPVLGFEHLDITEVAGADDLYHPEGIIARSERNAAALFGTAATFYSTEGSSQCVRAMLRLAGQTAPAGRVTILAARNVHKSFLHACALLDYDAEWLYGEGENSICSCRVGPEALAHRLDGMERLPAAFYLTSPDYLGHMADIAALAEVCHARGVPLLADNAHGAYLHFLPSPCHPIDLGADACCDSGHKTLPVLTGGAYLHLGKTAPAAWREHARLALTLFGSTSPSYLTLQSLDACNARLAGKFSTELAGFVERLDSLKAELAGAGVPLLPGEVLKVVADAAAMGYTGEELADLLRKAGGECEFADWDYLVAMLTPDNPLDDLDLLRGFLTGVPRRAPLVRQNFRAPVLRRACSIREAVLSPHRTCSPEEAVGKVCASPAVSCPPAVPIAVSGEVIDENAAALFRAYGIDKVDIMA